MELQLSVCSVLITAHVRGRVKDMPAVLQSLDLCIVFEQYLMQTFLKQTTNPISHKRRNNMRLQFQHLPHSKYCTHEYTAKIKINSQLQYPNSPGEGKTAH